MYYLSNRIRNHAAFLNMVLSPHKLSLKQTNKERESIYVQLARKCFFFIVGLLLIEPQKSTIQDCSSGEKNNFFTSFFQLKSLREKIIERKFKNFFLIWMRRIGFLKVCIIIKE